MENIVIYKQEINDGLEEAIRSSTAVAYLADLKMVDNADLDYIQIDKLSKSKANINETLDLYPVDAILASVGWNKNDDIFHPADLWKARNSAKNKPVNIEHRNREIIGHMTKSYALDVDGNLLDMETEIPPEIFDIAVSSVIYKKWDDDEFEKQIAEMIVEISEGQWKVSMECLFPKFDYGIITPDGLQKVVARDESTSFLTKHLRAYGGTGEYQGNKVGRMFRDYFFSAKGFVRKPGNARSIVLNTNKELNFASASIVKDIGSDEKTNMEKDMDLQKALEKAEARADKAEAQLESTAAKMVEKEKEVFSKQIAALEVDVEDAKKEITKLESDLKAKADELDSVKNEKKTVEIELKEAKAELAKSESEKAKAVRVSALVDAGMDKEKAEVKVENLKAVSDEAFAEVVELAVAAYDMSDDKKKAKQKEDETKAKEKAKADEGVDPSNVEIEKTELEKSEAADINLDGNTDSVSLDEYSKGVSAWIGKEEKE